MGGFAEACHAAQLGRRMLISSIDVHHVAVPLKRRIKHASHERTTSDNLIVRVRLGNGQVGVGEGVPRSYVTGETIETAFDAISSFDAARAIGRPADMQAVVEALARFTLPSIEADPRGMAGNAARCALELAILDAYGRAFGVSASQALRMVAIPGLPLRDRPGLVWYSGAITAEDPVRELYSALKLRLYRFSQTKIKVGVDGQDDPRRLQQLRRILGPRMDIRIDANEAWGPDELIEKVAPLLPGRPSALEQPVSHENVDCLAELRPGLGVPVMLDESLCGEPDGRRAIERGLADLFNVRLSKCGGIFPSLRLVAMARSAGLGVQLGCHPGETGVLSAAGRHVASNVRGFRYVEGSYDRHVLARNITTRGVNFTIHGLARPIKGPGLGVDVDETALDALTVRKVHLDHA
jgi:L-alanine-DL-glutamate epimerase-like enolase superfamily enzyme